MCFGDRSQVGDRSQAWWPSRPPAMRTHAKGNGHMLSSHFQVGGVHGNRLAPHGPREPWPRPHNIDRFGASLGAAMWTFAGPRCHLGGSPQPWHRALWPIRPPKLHAGCWGFVCAPSHGLVFTVPHPMPPGTTLCRKPNGFAAPHVCARTLLPRCAQECNCCNWLGHGHKLHYTPAPCPCPNDCKNASCICWILATSSMRRLWWPMPSLERSCIWDA